MAPPADLYAAPTTRDHIGRVVAPVTVNGKGPFRFIVDTGANRSVMTMKLAQQLGLTPNPGDGLMVYGVTGSQRVPTISTERLDAGEFSLHHIDMPVLDTVMSDADGILGMQGLDDMRLEVDFGNNRINISRSRGQRTGHRFFYAPVKLRFGQLLVADADVGGVYAHAVIDTGAERTLGNIALRDSLLQHFRMLSTSQKTLVFGVTPRIQAGQYAEAPPIRIGNARLETVRVTYGDLYVFKVWGLDRKPALLLGMDVLGSLDKLVVDYKLKEIQMRPRI